MEEAMSRISIKTKADLPAELRPLWDRMTTYGAFENQAGVMAHRPPLFKHVWSLLVDLADEAVVSKRYLELALVAVSLLNKCTYCVSHHAPKLAIRVCRRTAPSACSITRITLSSTMSTSSLSNMRSRSPTIGTGPATKSSPG